MLIFVNIYGHKMFHIDTIKHKFKVKKKQEVKMIRQEGAQNPPCNGWEEYEKPVIINGIAQEICDNIAKKGKRSMYTDIFDLIYEHIEDNFMNYFPGIGDE